MIPIVWKEYSCTMSGAVLKFVECEKCQTRYVYQMNRQVMNTGSSLYFLDNQGAESRARSGAEQALQSKLDEDCDGVPCLNCGTYQRQMVSKLKNERYSWLPWVVVISPLVAVLLGAWTWMGYNHPATASEHTRNRLILTVVVGLVSLISAVAQFINSRFDPNAAPLEERRALGRQLAVTFEEFEQLSKEQQKRT